MMMEMETTGESGDLETTVESGDLEMETTEGSRGLSVDIRDTNTIAQKTSEVAKVKPQEMRNLNYPSAYELKLMEQESEFDLKLVSQMMKGPRCWKCYLWGPCFNCKNCGRHFHNKCVYMAPGFPAPKFDQQMSIRARELSLPEQAQLKLNLIKCPCCLVENETRLAQLRNVSQEELNETLSKIAEYMVRDFTGILGPDHYMVATLVEIREKTSMRQYKTLEGFHASFQGIVFDTISKSSEACEETEVAKSIAKRVVSECANLLMCFECYSKRWNCDGRVLNARDYVHANTTPCKVPHLIIWAKEKFYPYWPAKLLALTNGKIIIQNFRESANVKAFSFPLQPEETLAAIMQFSLDYPGNSKSKTKTNTWYDAKRDCDKYIKNTQERFGTDGVVIPQKAEPFPENFQLEAAIRKMYPKFSD